MFEHRLGLALGKSIAEIRRLSAPEFDSWKLYALAEPFGWQNDEYRLAYVLAMMFGAFGGKSKSIGDFMRDNAADTIRELEGGAPAVLEGMNEDERAAFIKEQVKRFFGAD